MMRKFFLKATIFIFIVISCDYGVGKIFESLHERAYYESGGGKVSWAISQKSEIFIFGSSRATHHYIPDIIQSKTGLSTFNAGMDAQTILYHYGVEQLLFEKHTPSIIVLDLNVIDIANDHQGLALQKISALLPYHQYPAIREMLLRRGLFENIRLYSSIYPYNSTVLPLFGNIVFQLYEKNKLNRGYMPLFGSSLGEILLQGNNNSGGNAHSGKIEPYYLDVVEKFIQLAKEKKVSLIICHSPLWEIVNGAYKRKDPELYGAYISLIDKYNVHYVEVTQDNYPIFNKVELFKDLIHLNHNGAEIFSEIIGTKIKNYYQQGSSNL